MRGPATAYYYTKLIVVKHLLNSAGIGDQSKTSGSLQYQPLSSFPNQVLSVTVIIPILLYSFLPEWVGRSKRHTRSQLSLTKAKGQEAGYWTQDRGARKQSFDFIDRMIQETKSNFFPRL
jgi:hypothetical protein